LRKNRNLKLKYEKAKSSLKPALSTKKSIASGAGTFNSGFDDSKPLLTRSASVASLTLLEQELPEDPIYTPFNHSNYDLTTAGSSHNLSSVVQGPGGSKSKASHTRKTPDHRVRNVKAFERAPDGSFELNAKYGKVRVINCGVIDYQGLSF
jgi:hypothetical protein